MEGVRAVGAHYFSSHHVIRPLSTTRGQRCPSIRALSDVFANRPPIVAGVSLWLASSDWYFSPQEHRCPHDAWLESVTISEPSSGERHDLRTTSIRTRLLGAFRNGFIEFIYPQVFRYSLEAFDSSTGHRDWRYDEFRLSDCGHVIHEIEWCGAHDTARWVIECADVQFLWHPNQGT
jgi:hypothetical protein